MYDSARVSLAITVPDCYSTGAGRKTRREVTSYLFIRRLGEGKAEEGKEEEEEEWKELLPPFF